MIGFRAMGGVLDVKSLLCREGIHPQGHDQVALYEVVV